MNLNNIKVKHPSCLSAYRGRTQYIDEVSQQQRSQQPAHFMKGSL